MNKSRANTKNNLFFDSNSPEFKLFNPFGIFEKKEGINEFKPYVETFLNRFAPERIAMFNRILKKLKFKFKGEIIIDLFCQNNVAGYFSPTENIIAVNPWVILEYSEAEIASVIFHEGIHAGIYTNGVNVWDESLVETLTKKGIDEMYSEDGLQSGYDSMVSELSEFFSELSFQELIDKVEDGDELTFDNLLEQIIISRYLNKDNVNVQDFKWSSIEKRLKDKWNMIQRLFPRMVNKLAKNGRGLHENGEMSLHHYKMEGLLNVAATKIFDYKKDLILDILLDVSDQGEKVLTAEEIKDILFEKGYGYIYDKSPQKVDQFINTYIVQMGIIQLTAQKLDNIDLKQLVLDFC
jgi:hypothetical protein